MGLDMYLYKVPKKYYKDQFTETFTDICKWQELEKYEIGYWRKYWDLHRYFCILCMKKKHTMNTNVYEDFQEFEITAEDLDNLKKLFEENDLKPYFEDFDYKKYNLKVIKKAKKAIKKGYHIFYDASW